MARLRGTGLGAGTALGTAAIIRTSNGIPLLPEMPRRLYELAAKRRLTETPEVILVAEDYATALALSGALAWAKVVGIAAEKPAPDAPLTSLPAVVGLPDLMKTTADDVLLLVDATQGAVLVDPDPVYLAQYTAEHDRIAPKRRFFLDEAHLPAVTLDGRTITVVACDSKIEEALASGADALSHSLPLTFDPAILRRHLDELVRMTSGKPLIFPYNASLPLSPILEAAARADITLVVPPVEESGADVAGVKRLVEEIAIIQAECAENDTICGSPGIAGETGYRALRHWPAREEVIRLVEQLAAEGVTRLFFSGMAVSPAHFRHLEILIAATREHLIPLIFYVHEWTLPFSQSPEDIARSVRLLIGAGVSGFQTDYGLQVVGIIKTAIRESSMAECESQLQFWLANEPESVEPGE